MPIKLEFIASVGFIHKEKSKRNLFYYFQLNVSVQKATNDGLSCRNPVKTQFILLHSTIFFGPKGNK